MSILNNNRQATVDSLNRIVDAMVIKANTPSPREVVLQKAAAIHLTRQAALRKAVKNGEIKTQKEMRQFDGGLRENFRKAERSITDPVLHEEFMQAYFSYFNLNDQLYDSLEHVLPPE